MLTVTEWYLICQQIFLMEELFRLVRDENDIDKALSMIRSGYMLEPSYKDQYNCSLLFHAIYRKSLELVKTLVEKGFDVNDRLPDGATPLMSAAKNNVIDIAEYLLENGAELDACDEEGWTALDDFRFFQTFRHDAFFGRKRRKYSCKSQLGIHSPVRCRDKRKPCRCPILGR